MSIVDDLARDLRDATDTRMLHIAWDALTLTVAATDALTWQDGIEPTAALGAAMAASAGRDLLPLPQEGTHPQLPATVDTALTGELARLLDELRPRLDRAGRAADHPDQVYALHACADRTAEAAACLRTMPVPG
ncbi:hypothetical protein [Streptomyces sp. NPDC001380]|uniref:hypothetical protein n=1 Tax=Streptomyces sp. NPDC001380 TaxID=3364566 RepID=UPI0036774778